MLKRFSVSYIQYIYDKLEHLKNKNSWRRITKKMKCVSSRVFKVQTVRAVGYYHSCRPNKNNINNNNISNNVVFV